MRKGFGPQVLTGISNFVIGLLRRVVRQPRTSPASTLRYFAVHPERALAILTD